MRWRPLALVGALLIGACTTPSPPPVPEAATPAPRAPAEQAKPRIESQPLKHLAGRNLKPMPIKPLNVKTRCRFRDEVTGTRGRLDLQVREDEVQRFAAEVRIPRHGTCRFEMKDFAQDRGRHPVTLSGGERNSCAVRVWEQESRFTVAFAECAANCEGNAHEYLWPILIDGKTGRCV